MASASRYRRFLKLCETWPVDASKTDRDLGVYIRKRIAEGFRQGDATAVDSVECDRIYESLRRIASNRFKIQNVRSKDSNATGLTLEDCRILTSTETLVSLQTEGISLADRVKLTFRKR